MTDMIAMTEETPVAEEITMTEDAATKVEPAPGWRRKVTVLVDCENVSHACAADLRVRIEAFGFDAEYRLYACGQINGWRDFAGGVFVIGDAEFRGPNAADFLACFDAGRLFQDGVRDFVIFTGDDGFAMLAATLSAR